MLVTSHESEEANIMLDNKSLQWHTNEKFLTF